jgi:hypothetical protein
LEEKRKGRVIMALSFFYHLYILGPAYGQKVVLTAEPVEKVRMAYSDNFCPVKNQQLTGHRKSKNAQIQGFSTASLCYLKIVRLKKLPYANHSCNNLGKFGTVDHGTNSELFMIQKHPQYVGASNLFCRNFGLKLIPKIRLTAFAVLVIFVT